MRRIRFVGVRIVLFGIVFLGAAGLVTTGLWNVLVPGIFGLPAINFWQALGLLLLGRLLFGGLGGAGHKMRNARCVRGWKDLTPEERERFSRAMGQSAPVGAGGGETAGKA